MLADWLHLVGMAFWLGGLAYFFTGVRHLSRLDDNTADPIGHPFWLDDSRSAPFSLVALIGLTVYIPLICESVS